MELIIAGYISVPADPADVRGYYEDLFANSAASGLELSWAGVGTGADLDATMPKSWSLTLNLIGPTMQACQADSAFGLASPSEGGREAATNLVREACDGVHAINDRLGRQAVVAIELHSAPGFGSREFVPRTGPFLRSLEELCALEWEGTAVLVEHCDAYVEGQLPAKGFLTLEEELDVLSALDGPVGLSLNWGRSVIEGRDPARAMDHVRAAASSGRLRAYTFSGAAGVATDYGPAWADSHHPFSETVTPGYGEAASLMRPEAIAPIVPYLDGCLFVAVKTNWPRQRTDPAERARAVRANFDTVTDALGAR